MRRSDSSDDQSGFVLAAWCTASKQWHDLPGRYDSHWKAQDAAKDRGIYRVTYLRDGKRLDMEPFAIVGDN